MTRLATIVTRDGEPRIELLAAVQRRVRAMRQTLMDLHSHTPDTEVGMAAEAACGALGELLKAGSPTRRAKAPTVKPDRKSAALPRCDR